MLGAGNPQAHVAIVMISISCCPEPTTSPTALPIIDLATGDTKEIDPALGSASSSPTIRYVCTRPSARLKVTVQPKATASIDSGRATGWAVRRRRKVSHVAQRDRRLAPALI